MTSTSKEVLEFYRALPFNYHESVSKQIESIRATNAAEAYTVLPPLLSQETQVLDVGCGSGWLVNTIAYYYKSQAVGIDFNPVAIERAQAVANSLKLPVRFIEADLFLFEPDCRFDVVISLGVLHHTDNCSKGLTRICRHFVKPGGYVLIGLYHKYGRKPFIDFFKGMKYRGATEEEMFKRYQQLHRNLTDDTHLRSWFRDQVLHPHETHHTQKEMAEVLHSANMVLVASSINRFQRIESLDALFAQEQEYEAIGLSKLKKKQYFPGFFVFLARKQAEEI